MCLVSKEKHNAAICGKIAGDTVHTRCGDGCPPIKASDPEFFKKLDEYLERGCYMDLRDQEKLISAMQPATSTMPGPSI
jgi:hypothetical protein